jgi:hypothetical protein
VRCWARHQTSIIVSLIDSTARRQQTRAGSCFALGSVQGFVDSVAGRTIGFHAVYLDRFTRRTLAQGGITGATWNRERGQRGHKDKRRGFVLRQQQRTSRNRWLLGSLCSFCLVVALWFGRMHDFTLDQWRGSRGSHHIVEALCRRGRATALVSSIARLTLSTDTVMAQAHSIQFTRRCVNNDTRVLAATVALAIDARTAAGFVVVEQLCRR